MTQTGTSTSATLAPAAHPLGLSVLLHLVPGALAAAAYFGLVPVVHAWGLPTVAALALSGLVGVAPVQLTVLAAHRHLQRRRVGTPEPAVWPRARLGARAVLAWSAAVALSGAAVFVLQRPVSAWVESAAFAWWPTSLKVDLGTGGDFGPSAIAVTALLLLVGSVVVAPVVEELYFRGFLLPRMSPGLGAGAPATHAALFAAYHLWTPWLFPTRALAILPLVYAVRRTGSIRVGITAHIMVNAVDLVVLCVVLLTA